MCVFILIALKFNVMLLIFHCECFKFQSHGECFQFQSHAAAQIVSDVLVVGHGCSCALNHAHSCLGHACILILESCS
jgi:hypothetical protein